MFKKIASIQPLANDKLIVWFTDGETRLLDIAEMEMAQGTQPTIAAEGYGISWGEDLDMGCKEIHEASASVDIVTDECQRLITNVAEVRHGAGFSQAKLAAAAGVKQPVVARLETGVNSPRLDTLLKILTPLGKTLQIVDFIDVG